MNQIKISEIQIIPVKANSGLIAFASFILNDCLFISSVAVYTRLNGNGEFRLVYPSKQIGPKEVNVIYPINKQVGDYIEKEVSKTVRAIFNQKSDEYDRYSDFNSSRL